MLDEGQNLWGIDLGGTKVEGVILRSASNPEVIFRDRVPTESQQGYEHIMGQIKKIVDKMEAFAGYRAKKIGIATPGTEDPRLGTMKNCNTTALNGRTLKKDLSALLQMQLFMANDANCFALAEASMGIAKEKFPNARIVFGVIMGTGVGGGVVIDGKVLNGLQGIGGEWGHNFLDESGGPCYCGKTGCVEQVMSGPATEKYYESIAGQKKSLKEIYEAHLAGTDPYAVKTITRLIHFFGVALSVVVNIIDPDVVVIGGGVGNIDLLYKDGLVSLEKNIFNNRLDTPVLRPKLGDSAGVFGAAFLAV